MIHPRGPGHEQADHLVAHQAIDHASVLVDDGSGRLMKLRDQIDEFFILIDTTRLEGPWKFERGIVSSIFAPPSIMRI